MDDMIKRLQKLSTSIRLKVDSYLPRHCLLCQQSNVYSSLCSSCLQDLPVTPHGCDICGQAIANLSQPICGSCLSRPPKYTKAVAAFDYSFPVTTILQALKYQDKGHWAHPIAKAAYNSFTASFAHLTNARLIPVPMHTSQYQHRRDNHAELLCRYLSLHSGLPMLKNHIIKHRATQRQAGLSAKARARNLKGSFSLRTVPPDYPIILVDDVMTTGSTLNILADLLQHAGIREVYGFAIARKSLI